MGTSHVSGLPSPFAPISDIQKFSAPANLWNNSAAKEFCILAIDDDPKDKRLLRLALKCARFPGDVTIRIADDCETALTSLISGTAPLPSLVLINLERKGKRCLKALENLKQSVRTSGIPVAAWARTGDTSLDDAYAAYANCVLQKPETVEEAEAALTSLVRFWSMPGILLPHRR
jgi:CheY-like chemotaxis protein